MQGIETAVQCVCVTGDTMQSPGTLRVRDTIFSPRSCATWAVRFLRPALPAPPPAPPWLVMPILRYLTELHCARRGVAYAAARRARAVEEKQHFEAGSADLLRAACCIAAACLPLACSFPFRASP